MPPTGDQAPEAPRSILVLGGTGNTGRRVVRQAVSRGFAVHALVRSRDRLEARSERLQVVEGTPQTEADMR